MRLLRPTLLAALTFFLYASALPIAPAQARSLDTSATAAAFVHPLGNFTVNHYNGLRVSADRVRNHAVVDLAELPTLQAAPDVDSTYAARTCTALATAQSLKVDGRAVPWKVTRSAHAYAPGQGGLQISRLTCELVAETRVTGTVTFTDAFEQDRIGWREITATGDGVPLAHSSVPATSVSDELRRYPDDLLSDALDQRTATFATATPGGPDDTGATAFGGTDSGKSGVGISVIPVGGPLGDAFAALDRLFTGLVGADDLTVPLGLLALGLAVVLGAGHALIPGHGKTIMAAYLAGRRGRPRDAVTVGATVTATHTGTVLVVGLILSAFTTLAGESVLSWLGVASGLLIALIGLRLLLTTHRPHSHGHGHGYGHGHGHGHGDGDPHGNEHRDGDGDPHGAGRGKRGFGLVGLGVAGGLVPSPSALIVLLGAIALGRTWFGVALVTAYGLGMAATLTVTGLLLVKLADRLEQRASAGRRLATRLSALAPLGTATMVVLLGAGLALRSAVAL
ncbi:nickel/cobalt transporter [Nonomuraea glycinis]|uniref:nickel/cobalt transporter n=1 Tax=Nonomuraea glycinis TaxID=2047744 RepID=UPI0033AE4254